MNFLDIFDVFSNASLIGSTNSEKRKPNILILFYILLIPSIFWLAIELKSISKLLSPILFVVLFLILGVILSVLILILIYKLNLIEQISKKDFSMILLPICIITISAASLINRANGLGNKNFSVTMGTERMKGFLGFDYLLEKKIYN